MKSYKRFFSLFLCSLLCCGLFSITANADSIDTSNYKVNIYAYENNVGSIGQGNLDNGGSDLFKNEGSKKYTVPDVLYFRHKYTFVDKTGKAMFEAGKKYTFTAENLYQYFEFLLPNGSTFISSSPDGILMGKFVYLDGSEKKFTGYSYKYNSQTQGFSLSAEIEPDKDVYKIIFWTQDPFNVKSTCGSSYVGIQHTTNYKFYYGTPNQGNPLDVKITVQSEEAGLLDGILGWIKNIFDTVEESWKVMSAGFANIGTWFAELPGKIWDFIENGLKNLFVPDNAYMESYSDRWNQLLESRLGAVYQVCNIVADSWDSIMNADQTNSISIPAVSIPLKDTTFTFGGEDVKIVPDGFSAVVTALKLIIGIVCTYLFINGLLKRYDEVMGVER